MRREEINIRDPFVLTRNGQYYLYGTRGATCWGPADGFDVYVSRDLENWDGPFECFHNDGTFWADRNYWAPEVHEYHGKLYMLASFKREDLCRGTAILTADDPLGPFVPHSDGRVTPSDWECLDGTLYVSPDDKPYLVFAHEWVQVGDGEICAMPLSDDLSHAIGDPKPPVGTLRRIAISHVRGGDNGARGSYFIGIPEKAIEDVLLHDVVIAQHASEKAVLDEGAISELRGVYPDAHMIDDLGDAPARGLWARHVHGLSLAGYDVIPDKKDARPYLVAETDVTMDKNACL